MSHEPTEKQKRLAHLRALNEAREKAAEAKAEDDELVELELVQKFVDPPYNGTRGVDFDLVSTPEGFIVVKLGEWVSYKKFTTGKFVNGMPTPEATIAFVIENLAYPDRDKFNAINNKFGGVASRCANRLIAMHEGDGSRTKGK